jgi:MFS family permease
MASPSEQESVEATPSGAWAPLRRRLFVVLWLASVLTNLAAFMIGLGTAWVLTDLTDSPLLIALLPAAVALPMFALALFAGALADIVNRKRLLAGAQAAAIAIALAFAILTATDLITTAWVLVLTGMLGVVSALSAPSWIAILPDLVERDEIPAAMTLSSSGLTLAQALGPALGGVIIAVSAPEWVFALNAALFAVVLLSLRFWTPPARDSRLPPEHLMGAVRLGVRYARNEPGVWVVIGKVVPFALVNTALIALLPAIARFRLDVGPGEFGLLSGAQGVGAILMLIGMTRLRRRLGPDAIVAVGMTLIAGVFIVLSLSTELWLALLVLVAAGAATLAIISTVMTAIQTLLPAWVRGRGLAVYLLFLQASFAVGAVTWGLVAEAIDLGPTLFAAGIAMLLVALVTVPFRLARYADVDSEAEQLLSDPVTVTSLHADDGPILLSVRWAIDPDRVEEFSQVMASVRSALKRQGALAFHLVEDLDEPGVLYEHFTVATWGEYQRLPKRATVADRKVEDELRKFVPDGELPQIKSYHVRDIPRSK